MQGRQTSAETSGRGVRLRRVDDPQTEMAEWAEPSWPVIRRQLFLLGAFVVLVAVLFALAGTVLASGGGCGGG
jgi:hypothetical protein